jgi:hypothetical protein
VAGYASRDWVLALSSLLLLLLPPAPEGIGLGFCTHEVFFKKTLLFSVMSRCYPYPPPGYEKEAHKLTDLAPPITKVYLLSLSLSLSLWFRFSFSPLAIASLVVMFLFFCYVEL